MSGSANSRIPANWVGLIFALLLAVWLAFTFIPRSEKPAPAAAPVTVESKLHAVGLADNPDWEGLPEIFAIWSDHAEWKEGKTRFAYLHPGTKTYSYYFQATRVNGDYRFREIAEPHDSNHVWDESLGEECPIRFFKPIRENLPIPELSPSVLKDPVADGGKPRVPVEIPKAKLSPPAQKP
jgi:hypothetical protein